MVFMAFYMMSMDGENGLSTNHRAGYKRNPKENQGGAVRVAVPATDYVGQSRAIDPYLAPMIIALSAVLLSAASSLHGVVGA
jgi:hypothetical protein